MDDKFNRIYETAESGSIASAVPEHTLNVVYQDEEKKLEENNMEKSLKKRLELRKEFNERLFEAIDNKTLSEELQTDISPLNTVRYKLQDWHNGKGDGTDHETGYDGPSDYEAWRRGIIDKKRKARLAQENEDRTSEFRSPCNTDTNFETLDNQRDDFLNFYIKKFGPVPEIK